jgi:hypothetical protein
VDERIAEVRRLVQDHLTAAMIMVPLDAPLDPEMRISEAFNYLDGQGYDLALLATPEVRVVYRDRLADVKETKGDALVKTRAFHPRFDRLIEHSLELREVARRLKTDEVPLLVVGRDGPEHIVSRADFTRVAGQAGVLAVLAALDAQLDEILRPFDAEAWPLLDGGRKEEIEGLVKRAAGEGEEVHRLSYLTMRERFETVRGLRLGERLGIDLGFQSDHEKVTRVRNDIAHGREVPSGLLAIEALEIAEQLLDEITQYLGGSQT